MTSAFIGDVDAFFAKIKAEFAPVAGIAVSDAEAIGDAAFNYIKTNGLADLYKIATAALLGAATGAPWATTLATVVSQGESAGVAIAKGAEAVVLAQAQADLMAAGSLVTPTGTTLSPVTAAAPASV